MTNTVGANLRVRPKIVLNHDFLKIFRINKIKKTLCELREKTLCTLWFGFLPQRTQGIHKGHKKNPANLVNLAKISVLTIAFVGLSFGAFAQTASYIDASGNTQTASGVTTYTTGGSRTLISGWYMLSGSPSAFSGTLTISGTVHLILADGCNWTINGGGIRVNSGNSLTIYAQSTGSSMGRLTANGSGRSAGIGGDAERSCGTIIINGGTIEATGATASGMGGAGAGIGGGGSLSYYYGGSGGVINIYGGTVKATGGNGANGSRNGGGGSGAGIGGGGGYGGDVGSSGINCYNCD